MELEELTILTSDYTTKLQSSGQYGPGTEKYTSMEQNRKLRDKYMLLSVMTLMVKMYEKYSLDLNEVYHENRK